MAQVTIYIDDETERKMVAAAKASGMSKSRWITEMIRDRVNDDWPDAVKVLAGAWGDFPELDEIRSGNGHDAPREAL